MMPRGIEWARVNIANIGLQEILAGGSCFLLPFLILAITEGDLLGNFSNPGTCTGFKTGAFSGSR